MPRRFLKPCFSGARFCAHCILTLLRWTFFRPLRNATEDMRVLLRAGDPGTGPRLRLRVRSRPVVTRGTPSRRRVAGQQAGASRWHS